MLRSAIRGLPSKGLGLGRGGLSSSGIAFRSGGIVGSCSCFLWDAAGLGAALPRGLAGITTSILVVRRARSLNDSLRTAGGSSDSWRDCERVTRGRGGANSWRKRPAVGSAGFRAGVGLGAFALPFGGGGGAERLVADVSLVATTSGLRVRRERLVLVGMSSDSGWRWCCWRCAGGPSIVVAGFRAGGARFRFNGGAGDGSSSSLEGTSNTVRCERSSSLNS